MADTQASCPHCGAELEAGSQFCAACGRFADASAASDEAAKPEPAAPVVAAETPPADSPKQPSLARTMLGVHASQLFGGQPGAPAQRTATPVKGTPTGLFTTQAIDRSLAAPADARGDKGDTGENRETSEPASASPRTTQAMGNNAPTVPMATVPGAFSGVGASTIAGTGPATAPPSPAPQNAGAAPASSTATVQATLPPPPQAPAPSAAASPAASAPVSFPAAPNPYAPGGAGSQSMAGTPAEAIASERPRRSLAKTMLGISPEAAALRSASDPAPGPSQPAPNEPLAAAPASASQSGPARPNANPMARTMLGVANPLAPVSQPAAAAHGPIIVPKNTLQGVPFPQGLPQPSSENTPSRQPDRGAMARTMLGMAPIGSSAPPPNTPSAAPGGGGVPPGFGGRTMLGVASPGSDSPPTMNAANLVSEVISRAPSGSPSAGRETTRVSASPRREIRALWPLVAATLVVVIATLVLLFRSPSEPQVDVSAKIVSSETGEALLFEVPSAPEGSKIRFGGQEKPISAGRATFALAADSLRVGDNLVLAEVVRPEQDPAPVRITLAVYYRIWVDTAALRAERSALDVIVTALPGTRVTLDGEDLKLDGAGRGTRSYPVDVVSEAKSGVIEHVVKYRVQPPSGETVVDELRTRIPVAMMQIDRPGREVLTDRDSIEIAGAVGKDTQVTLDKTAIPVKDGRFLYRLGLPQPGDYSPRIVASSPGKAPLGVTLTIKRVKDLSQAAAQFAPTPDLSYTKLAPNPVIYKGQKIALEGRVYAVDPRGSDSVIQMFVRPCPTSRRCPLWVSDPHATEVAVDAWIRVLGTVQGEQQFRSEKNEIVTVPKVEAAFVLPASP